MTLKELREKRKAAIEAKNALAANVDKWTDEDRSKHEEAKAEVARLNEQVSVMEDAERDTLMLKEPAPNQPPVAPVQRTEKPEDKPEPKIVPVHRVGKLKAFTGHNAEENAYRSGQWILASLYGHSGAAAYCRDHGIDVESRTAQSGTVNSLGGALVPPEFERAIIDLREEYGYFRQNARVIPMAGDTLDVPRRSGGLTAYFVGENASITESNKTWDSVKLTVRKLAALTKYSSEIAEDAIINVADDLAREMALAFATTEDSCGFLGTGTSTYGGITGLITACTTATASTVTAITGNTAFSTLDLADFLGMHGKLPQYPGIQPKWYISKAGWADSMARLVYAQGGSPATDVTGGTAQMTFLGYPVVWVNSMNSTLTAQTSTKGICYFGDLRMAAMLGERRGLRVKLSDQRYFEYDQLGIQATERVDIVVHDVGNTSVAGPIIMLAFPGS
jgi:HK97 family phage major capsid protein